MSASPKSKGDAAAGGGAIAPHGMEELYARPGFIIRRAHQIAAALFDEAAADLGITTTQYSLLHSLRAAPGIDQIGLCALTGIDRSTAAMVLRLLEENGSITRTPDPMDRRRKLLALTDQGARMLQKAEPATHVISDQMRTVLSDRELAQLTDLLGRFVSAFNGRVRNPLIAPAPALGAPPSARRRRTRVGR